ncbi:MAG: fibronectin type III domain-containing protein [Acidobacteriaceae bacterium]|nr:fibronectin type III domain-containing protein [Acidobacteriaceae bacterium]
MFRPLVLLLSLAAAPALAQTIAAGGVVNAADYTAAVAPGSLIAIFGANLAPATTSAAATPLPTSLAGASVEVNGQPIPLFFVSAGQINGQMPFGLSGAVSVRVRTATGLSPAVSLPLAPAAPRLFTRSMDGKGDPILVRATDWTMVTAAAPAQPGDYLILFLTGLGNVSPAISAGTPAGDNAANGPLNQLPAGAVTVTFGGKAAPVLFAGLAPGFVGLYQINFQVPAAPSGNTIIVATRDAASSDTTALPAPTRVTVSAAAEQTVGARRFGSSSQLALAWTAPSYPVDHYQITAAESLQGTTVSATARSLSATLTGLKAATPYAITVKACADAPCRQSGAASPVTGSTATEYWQLRGAGNTTAGLTRIVRNGNVRISATRFGPEAGPVTANRIQLYYGPMPPPNAALITALTPSAANAADPASYLSFTNPGATTGLLTPSSPAPLIESIATGQGVPMTNGKVRLFFEAQGPDRKTRIFSLDSVDGFTGQDFNSGAATTCSTTADYSPGGGCPLSTLIGVEGDTTLANPRIPHARQHKVAFPTQTDWRWDGAPGTFLVFTTDRIPGCATGGMNHGYAVWDGARWNVQYAANGCPKLFLDAQAAFPMHLGGQRYKLYYGDPTITTGKGPTNLPFLGPKKLIYSDGAVSGSLDRVDFEDWERQSLARDVVFLWPNGDPLNDTAEGYIDDYHFLAPTGSLDLQVMYLAITNGTEIPFASAATLLNP